MTCDDRPASERIHKKNNDMWIWSSFYSWWDWWDLTTHGTWSGCPRNWKPWRWSCPWSLQRLEFSLLTTVSTGGICCEVFIIQLMNSPVGFASFSLWRLRSIAIWCYHLRLLIFKHPDSTWFHHYPCSCAGRQGEPRPVGRQHRLGGRALGQAGAEGSIQGTSWDGLHGMFYEVRFF